jgi:hypothetical protein
MPPRKLKSPDGFRRPIPDELLEASQLIDAFFRDMEGVHAGRTVGRDVQQSPTFKTVTALSRGQQVKVVRAAAERIHWNTGRKHTGRFRMMSYLADNTPQHFRYVCEELLLLLCRKSLSATEGDLVHLLTIVRRGHTHHSFLPRARPLREPALDSAPFKAVIRLLRDHVKENGLSERLRSEVEKTLAFLNNPQMDGAAWIGHRAADLRELLATPRRARRAPKA